MKLNKKKQIKNKDNGQVAESIKLLPDQIRQVLYEARLIKIPADYKKANKVAIIGMGGSALGARIIESALADQVKVPVKIISGYELPAWIDNKTICLLSSYSGSTEEVLSAYPVVKKQGAKMMAITSQGKNKLEKMMLKDNVPGYIFKPEYNPSGEPRLGLGYTFFGTAVLLAKAGLFKLKIKEIEDIVASLEIWDRELRPEVKKEMNPAKKIAGAMYRRQAVLVGGEFLAGNLHTLRNQICENSKNFASYLVLPALNHFALEGLTRPASNRNNLVFIFFNSRFYHKRTLRRLELTKQILKNKEIGISFFEHKLNGKDKLTQVFEILQFGSWASFYLAELNKVNPAEIKWVNWFKKKLR